MKRSYDNAFRQEQAQQTRARILEALIDQVGRGQEEFSIAEVARAARVSVRTVYQHFPNREAQIEAMIGVLDKRLTNGETGPKSVAEIPAMAERLIRHAANHMAEVRAQTASGIAREVRARRRKKRDGTIASVIAGEHPAAAARLAGAAVSVLISGEIAIGLTDRFGIAGEDLVRTHSWIVRVVAEAIARGDLPAPSTAVGKA